MSCNLRVIRKKMSDDEILFEKDKNKFYYGIYEVFYNADGLPYNVIGNGINSDVEFINEKFKDLLHLHNEIEKAYKAPVLEFKNGKLIEMTTCPECGEDISYDVMDVMGSGKEYDFGKTTLICSKPKGCGYVAVRQDYSRIITA